MEYYCNNGCSPAIDIGRAICFKFQIGDKVWLCNSAGSFEVLECFFDGTTNSYTISKQITTKSRNSCRPCPKKFARLPEDVLLTGSEYANCRIQLLQDKLLDAQEKLKNLNEIKEC